MCVCVFVCVCVCVCVHVGGQQLSFNHVGLNNKDEFCKYNFIDFSLELAVLNLPKLSQALLDFS